MFYANILTQRGEGSKPVQDLWGRATEAEDLQVGTCIQREVYALEVARGETLKHRKLPGYNGFPSVCTQASLQT